MRLITMETRYTYPTSFRKRNDHLLISFALFCVMGIFLVIGMIFSFWGVASLLSNFAGIVLVLAGIAFILYELNEFPDIFVEEQGLKLVGAFYSTRLKWEEIVEINPLLTYHQPHNSIIHLVKTTKRTVFHRSYKNSKTGNDEAVGFLIHSSIEGYPHLLEKFEEKLMGM